MRRTIGADKLPVYIRIPLLTDRHIGGACKVAFNCVLGYLPFVVDKNVHKQQQQKENNALGATWTPIFETRYIL